MIQAVEMKSRSKKKERIQEMEESDSENDLESEFQRGLVWPGGSRIL